VAALHSPGALESRVDAFPRPPAPHMYPLLHAFSLTLSRLSLSSLSLVSACLQEAQRAIDELNDKDLGGRLVFIREDR